MPRGKRRTPPKSFGVRLKELWIKPGFLLAISHASLNIGPRRTALDAVLQHPFVFREWTVIRTIATCLGVLLLSQSAYAQTIVFSQNFESGLGGQESTSGAFIINNTGFGNNGTQMMGHPGPYGDSEYSFYQISSLVIPNATSILMQFAYVGQLETHFDRFNVQISTSAINPPGDIFFPTAGSNMQFIDLDHDHHPSLGQFAYDSDIPAGGNGGVANFDLTPFAGQTINIRFQFGSDESVTEAGFNMDNLSITAAAVPEPASMLSLASLAGIGLYYARNPLRRWRAAAKRFARF
jgi:hypothetical protein